MHSVPGWLLAIGRADRLAKRVPLSSIGCADGNRVMRAKRDPTRPGRAVERWRAVRNWAIGSLPGFHARAGLGPALFAGICSIIHDELTKGKHQDQKKR